MTPLHNSPVAETKGSEGRFERLADTAPVGIFRTDTSGNCTYVNREWCAITGVEEADALNRGWEKGLHSDDRELVSLEWDRAVREHRRSEVEYRFVRPKGQVVWVKGLAEAEKNDSGRVIGYIGTITDITLQKQADRELRDAHDLLENRVKERTADLKAANLTLQAEIAARTQIEFALRTSKEHAESANRAKSVFLANMSHELRTPLNGILGFASLLESDAQAALLTVEQSKKIAAIIRSGQDLLQLIDEILDLARIESGHVVLEVGPVFFSDLIDACLKAIDAQAKNKSLRLSSHCDDIEGFHADQNKLQQVVVNLLSNACKFTPEGGQVGVEARKDGDVVVVTVWDTGIGIHDRDQKEIFSEFHQVESSSSRRYGGTGLGLSLAKSLVELHDGEIWVSSKPGEGSRFSFSVPNRA